MTRKMATVPGFYAGRFVPAGGSYEDAAAEEPAVADASAVGATLDQPGNDAPAPAAVTATAPAPAAPTGA